VIAYGELRRGAFESERQAIAAALPAEAHHNRKRPGLGPGRFWGYYREERYVSLYMWIRGR
jgi:hypothetical protein